jgi:hypothetical protein
MRLMAKQASSGPAPFSGHSATSRARHLCGQFLFADFHGAIKAGQSGKSCAILAIHERPYSTRRVPFRSLWDKWVDAMAAEVEELRAADERWWLSVKANRPQAAAGDDQLCPDHIDVTFDGELPAHVPLPTAPKHQIRRELREGVWRMVCNMCHKPIPAVMLDGKSWAVPEVPLADPVCFEVTPYNLGLYQPEHEDKPHTHVERWRREPEQIVVCAACWACVPTGKSRR